jgi:hypothetical protein
MYFSIDVGYMGSRSETGTSVKFGLSIIKNTKTLFIHTCLGYL